MEYDKYVKSLLFVYRLEKENGASGLQLEHLAEMPPRDLYDYIFSEWWREWNGVLSEWEYRPGFSPEDIQAEIIQERKRKLSDELWGKVQKEVSRARGIYPEWQGDLVHAVAVASEEMGEVVKDANNLYWQQKPVTVKQIKQEIVQAMAMLVRLYEETSVLQEGETDD